MNEEGSYGIEIRPTYETRRTIEMIEESWLERFNAMLAQFVYRVTENFRKELLDRIPDTKEYRKYRRSIKLAKIIGLDSKSSAYCVFVDTGFGAAKPVDAPQTLLYISPLKTRFRRPDPKIQVLMKYNPWTLDSIPFVPRSGQAKIQSRVVTKQIVRKVTKERHRDKSKWRPELIRAGYRETNKRRMPQRKYVKAVPDMLFEAMKLEFGVGAHPVPAWRPAAHWTVKHGVTFTFRRYPKLLRAIRDPEFGDWRHWPKKVERKIRFAATAQSKEFLKRIGYG